MFGARPLRRVIQNELEDRLSEALLEGRFGPADTVVVDCEGGEIAITTQGGAGAGRNQHLGFDNISTKEAPEIPGPLLVSPFRSFEQQALHSTGTRLSTS